MMIHPLGGGSLHVCLLWSRFLQWEHVTCYLILSSVCIRFFNSRHSNISNLNNDEEKLKLYLNQKRGKWWFIRLEVDLYMSVYYDHASCNGTMLLVTSFCPLFVSNFLTAGTVTFQIWTTMRKSWSYISSKKEENDDLSAWRWISTCLSIMITLLAMGACYLLPHSVLYLYPIFLGLPSCLRSTGCKTRSTLLRSHCFLLCVTWITSL